MKTSLRDKLARPRLFAKEEKLKQCLRASTREPTAKWYNYVIPNCPAELPNVFNEMFSTETATEDEVVA